MNTWQNLSSIDRIVMWRQFRKDLRDLEKYGQIEEVAKFFSKTPIGSRCVDYYTPEDWPTPWEILHDGLFCVSSISILMYHTFKLLPAFKSDVRLLLVDDKADRYLLVLVDGKYILNYELGVVIPWELIKKKVEVLDSFDSRSIKAAT